MTTAAQRGTTVVSDRAVRKIAEQAAAEAAATPRNEGAKGTATVRGRRAVVGVEVALPYPGPLPEAVRHLQTHVTSRTRRLTGLDVGTTRVAVTALVPASRRTATPEALSAPPARAGTVARVPLRWWSQRRLPTALLTLVGAAACGSLAFDVIRVRLTHRPAAFWRTDSLHWLAHHGPDDPAVGVAAGVLAVLGLLLIVLALAPGRRGLLTLASPAGHVRAAMDRGAVALLITDVVRDVQGIGPLRVRVRRRRITVRAQLAFGEGDMARQCVTEAARRALDDCCLRRTPRLRVRVRPGDDWEPGPPQNADAAQRRLAPGVQGAEVEGVSH
ncbi:DUF6286 domain-containing protein [Streptomyces sp. NPDC050264]|uniref:DUF6286 domain-containing protein n=1 Tax=Streptomyces sp. NPDC050264 TaxID=3155038 RepID=UPI00343CC507